MKKEQEEMWVTTASAAVKTSASAQKGVAETTLKAMWKTSDIKPATAETHLRKCLWFNLVYGLVVVLFCIIVSTIDIKQNSEKKKENIFYVNINV